MTEENAQTPASSVTPTTDGALDYITLQHLAVMVQLLSLSVTLLWLSVIFVMRRVAKSQMR